MTRDRMQLFPSRANLVLMRNRLGAASKGLTLLKRKKEAMELKLRKLKAELRDRSERSSELYFDAKFTLAKANYLDTDLKPASIMNSDHADAYLHQNSLKVAGVTLPYFTLSMHASKAFPLTGIARGGEQVDVIRKRYRDALFILVEVASLQHQEAYLSDAVAQTTKRCNGLEFVIVPRISNTIAYIRDELDEYEREDFYRLKRSQAKQKKNRAKFSEIVRKKGMAELNDMSTEENKK